VGSSKAFNVKIKSTTSMPSCLNSCSEEVDSGNSNLHQVGRTLGTHGHQVYAWCTRLAHLPTGSVPQVVVRILALYCTTFDCDSTALLLSRCFPYSPMALSQNVILTLPGSGPATSLDVKSGYCYIDRHCYANGEAAPYPGHHCQTCNR